MDLWGSETWYRPRHCKTSQRRWRSVERDLTATWQPTAKGWWWYTDPRTQQLDYVVFVGEEVPCINDGPGDFGGVHVSFWGCICSKILCVYDTESRWRWRHWRICVRGHDKPLHRNCCIYFPGGIDNMSLSLYIYILYMCVFTYDTWHMI